MGIQLRILFSMLLVIILSLTGTIWVAWKFANRQDQQYNDQRLIRKEAAVQSSLEYVLERMPVAFDTHEIPLVFSDRICELSDVHALQVALYSPTGTLLTQSSVLSGEGAMVGLPETVIAALSSADANVERIDLGSYVLAYWFFKNLNGEVVGIANVRYDKRTVETGDFQGFLSQLAPLYVMLFIGGVILAVLLSNGLVRNLRMIRDRMRELDPTQEQRPIEYNHPDAIGELVAQYNKLLLQLQQTMGELAQREREGAWRIMAMQVAHEIKNPLTPLKLGVQQLEKSYRDGRPDFDERLQRFCATAVAQIDVLSSISKDFSRLAEIRLDAVEPTSLKDLLQEVLDLYESASPNVQWVVSQIQDDALVMASHSHLLRVYINLVKNALHAIENVEHPRVEIRCSAQDLGWEVAIIDNGVGIDDLRIKQIFEPRFTLKEGGTGLGLTIVKSVIVQLGGKVSVSSRQGEGSAFKIWLPRI